MSAVENQFEWENVKENARPLKAGYKQSALSRLLDSPVQRDDLEEERRAFETEVTANGGNDPLDAWKRYIAWAEVNATTGGIAIDRKALLERCAIAFRDYREYKDDERYIKVCLKYADACEDPREVFLFMEKKGIGVASLLTYQCWALVHENMGQVQEAERVYETGKVKCTGQDAQKLAGLQQLFRERAAEAARHKDEDQDEEPAAHSGRQAFAEVKRKRGGRAANNRAPTGKSRGGLKALRRTGDEKSNAGKLEVFHDPEGEQSSLNPAYSARSFPAESDTRKENAQAAGNWKRGVKSKAKEVAPCNFAIFQDEEDSGPAQPTTHTTTRQDFERKALGNYKAPKKVALLKDFARERGIGRRVDGGVLGYDPAPLFGTSEEFSFEEMRGQAWAARAPVQQPEPSNMSMEMETEDQPVAMAHQQDSENSFGQKAAESPGFPPRVESPPAHKASAPSPTINTKEAMAEVMAMFGSSDADSSRFGASTAGTAAPVSTAQNENSSASSFEIFSDENDENAAPAAYNKPSVSAAQQAAEEHSSVRGILQSVPGLAAQPQHSVEPDDQENAAPPRAEAASSKALQFDDVMKNLGLQTQQDQRQEQEAAKADADTGGFAIFEDPPTVKVSALPSASLSFTHSTPFAGGSTSENAPAANDFQKRSSAFARLEEEDDYDSLSPILEASVEVSMIQGANISAISRGSGGNMSVMSTHPESEVVSLGMHTQAPRAHQESEVVSLGMHTQAPRAPVRAASSALQWPLARETLLSRMAHVDMSSMENCMTWPGDSCPHLSEGTSLSMENISEHVHVRKELSSTDSGATFFAVAGGNADQDDAMSDDDENGSSEAPLYLSKSSPPCPWGFYILQQLLERTDAMSAKSAIKRSFPQSVSLHFYDDAHLLVVDHMNDFTLEDVIGMNQKLGKTMDEPMVMFYTVEMLRILEALHGANIAHCNWRPNNLVLRNEQTEQEWDINYNAAGKSGWSSKGLRLCNFEQSIDMTRFEAKERFQGRPGVWDDIKEYNDWTYEVDYHGVLNVIHKLLHGEDMEVQFDENKKAWTTVKTFKRYWQIDLWDHLFEELLNAEAESMPSLSELRHVFEVYLGQNPYKARSLKQSLMKQDIKLFEYR